MHFGFCLPHSGEQSKPEKLTELAVLAEKLGFDTLVESSDHIVVPRIVQARYPYSISGEYTDSSEDLEQLTTLAFVAAKTTKIRLMTGVMVVPYRNPFLAAKMLATIDFLSRGRLTVGAGVGWMEDEFAILNVPYPERGRIVDEYLRIFKEVWTSKNPKFRGKYFEFSDAIFSPTTYQKPHPPIWIGGESPRAIRRAAELGDGWFPLGSNPHFPLKTPGQMKAAINQLEQSAVKAKRKPQEIQVGYFVPELNLTDTPASHETAFFGNAAKIESDVQAFQDLGVSFLGVSLLRESIDKTKTYAGKFASEVMSKF